MTFPKVRIHMSTLKKLAKQCRTSRNDKVDLICSVKSGRIIAYPDGVSGIAPGSWCLMNHDLYPLWKDGRFVGTVHDGEEKDYSEVFSLESDLRSEEKIIYEIAIVPDDAPEDLSELLRWSK
jgi:hypothetical protein